MHDRIVLTPVQNRVIRGEGYDRLIYITLIPSTGDHTLGINERTAVVVLEHCVGHGFEAYYFEIKYWSCFGGLGSEIYEFLPKNSLLMYYMVLGVLDDGSILGDAVKTIVSRKGTINCFICERDLRVTYVEDRVVDTYRRSRTRMHERTRHRSGNTRSRVANGVTRHRRR